jgi:hypothetical protein
MFRRQFDLHADVVVGGQILQVGHVQGIEPADALREIPLPELIQRTVIGIALVGRTRIENFQQVNPDFFA